ncbi:hypothetical protein [Acidicapsa acidisoli]|uniref:hypothetical protein n=1 Tax=Acidicapsa acidisoli TaxID=1615681 RepID=UPI0021E04E98|nr:hypothetical protein [Acidicapsa acidisoli]
MSKDPDNFWTGFDACLKEARRELAARERVVYLGTFMDARQRASAGYRALENALYELEMTADAYTPTRGDIDALSAAETRVSLLKERQGMRKGLVHLVGVMGRPAP